MAGEPKRRHSKARKRARRAAINFAVSLIACKNCGKSIQSHIVCAYCGFYGTKEVAKPQKVVVTKA